MISISILEIKNMMAHLLLRESFDSFEVEEAEVVTFAKLTIQGKRNQNWYDSDEKLESEKTEYISWGEIRHIIFDYIKGERSPESMKITMKAGEELAEKLLEDFGVISRYRQEQSQLLLHIRYENGKLFLVTGVSYGNFTMNKEVEKAWDHAIFESMKKMKVSAEIGE